MKYVVKLNNKNYEVDVTETKAVITSVSDAAAEIQTPAPSPAAGALAEGIKVTAPMPGNILAVNIKNGQSVKAGDVMFILEAMKMENEIVAPADGSVRQILAAKGSVVKTDDVLAVI